MIMLSMNPLAHSECSSSAIREEKVSYTAGGITFKGFVAWDESIKGKLPVVLVVHEWWGLNDYTKMRVRKLAGLGYLAMAVDLFGNGKVAADPKEAQEFTGPYYQDPKLIKQRLDAAVKKVKEFKQADPTKIAAIGYCFGGFVILNYAKMGAGLKGVVVFHGGLGGFVGIPPEPDHARVCRPPSVHKGFQFFRFQPHLQSTESL